MNIEELKTAAGHLMMDLRGNWAFDYESRMYDLCSLLNTLIKEDPSNESSYKRDLAVTEGEIAEPYDGRIFRDSCILYAYSSEEGRTENVFEYLEGVLSHPEYNQIKL